MPSNDAQTNSNEPIHRYISVFGRNPANSSARRGLLFLCAIFLIFVYIIGFSPFLISLSNKENIIISEMINSDKFKSIILFSTSVIEHVAPMLLASIFGFLGGIVRTFTDRDEKFYADVENFVRNKLDITVDGSVPIGLIKLRKEQDYLIVSGISGLISYAVIKSNVILKIIYPKLNLDGFEIGFIPIIFFAFIFGLFAKNLLGFSDRYAQRITIEKTEKKRPNQNDMKDIP